MVNFRDIYNSIVSFASRLVKNISQLKVFVPQRREHGDISTNLAIIMAKEAKEIRNEDKNQINKEQNTAENRENSQDISLENNQEPQDISPKYIFDSISQDLQELKYIEKVDFLSGFCNITLSKEFLKEGLIELLLKKERFGTKEKNGLKVSVEYISANPTGYLHLGHTRGIYADTIANLLDFCGYEVTREYIINDVGNQIDLFARSIFHEYAKLAGILFDKPEGAYPGEHIPAIAEQIYAENKDFSWQKNAEQFSELCIEKSLLYIKEDLDFIGIKYDVWTSEKWLQKSGLVAKAIEILNAKGLVQEGFMGEIISGKGKKSEIPVKIFKYPGGEKALTKEDGSFTYFASDLGYHYYKIQRGFNKMIDFFGADHGGQVAPLEYAVQQLGGKKFSIVLSQSVAYTSDGLRKKFAKRKGNTIRPKDLEIDSGDLLRFLMTAKNVDTHYDIDLDAVSKIAENGFYYIQYANARCNSILKAAKELWPELQLDFDFSDLDISDFSKPFEFLEPIFRSSSQDDPFLEVISLLLQWPLEIEMCCNSFSIPQIHSYMNKLASKLHNLWTLGKNDSKLRFIIETEKEISLARLALVKSISYVLSSGFKILGINPMKQI